MALEIGHEAVSSVAGDAVPAVQPFYDAFISYSHAKDKALGSALQSAIQRLGKAWYQRRALRLFRDDTSLTATPHLWLSIETALRQSRFLIMLASPEAAASNWVDKELAWWLTHKSAETVLIALTAGELKWNPETGDFSASDVTPLPPSLRGRFVHEPLWIDLRPYRETANPRDARFTDLAASIASVLHGRAKEDLLSQEVRQQRRALRLCGSAVVLLLVLLGLAGWQWRVVTTQRDHARHIILAASSLSTHIYDLVSVNGTPSNLLQNLAANLKALRSELENGTEDSFARMLLYAHSKNEDAEYALADGNIKAALADAYKAREIIGTVIDGEPDNPDYEIALTDNEALIASALEENGELAAAQTHFRAALAAAEDLAKRDATNPIWQRVLWQRYCSLGDFFLHTGDNANALAAYRAALAISLTMVQANAESILWRQHLTISEEKLGEILQAKGDLIGALTTYRESLSKQEAMRKAILKVIFYADFLRDRASPGEKIGDVLQMQGDFTGAQSAYRQSVADRKKVLAEKGSFPSLQVELAIVLYKLAMVGDDAKDHLTEALVILKPLDAAGKLLPNWKPWIVTVEAALAKAT